MFPTFYVLHLVCVLFLFGFLFFVFLLSRAKERILLVR